MVIGRSYSAIYQIDTEKQLVSILAFDQSAISANGNNPASLTRDSPLVNNLIYVNIRVYFGLAVFCRPQYHEK
ncbi:MAG: hypothetical protein M0P20_06260 [Methanocorpusculum sp.]|jgi:hypothetical protein|nr:hypothetical protein [Methanocorpusculum sp.]MDD3257247.1 hypothetical protein [Methanocorpusculum sp.]